MIPYVICSCGCASIFVWRLFDKFIITNVCLRSVVEYKCLTTYAQCLNISINDLFAGTFNNFQFDAYAGEAPIPTNPISELNYYEKVLQSPTSKILSNNLLTLLKMQTLRTRMKVQDCRKTMHYPPVNCSAGCLFDLLVDPCESVNVANAHPDIYNFLWSKLTEYSSVLVPQQNKISDKRSDPALCNGTWWSWMDGNEGCWFRSTMY